MDIYDRLRVEKLINAAGNNTNIWGSLMAPEVFEAMMEAGRSFVDLVELSHQDSTDQANSESQDILRRSIFVALTRARDRIWLGGVSAQRQADWWTISEPPAVQQGDGR